ncbi:error-prone DNA polymerase [Dyella mobilis]|uniref:Error-prone DNA polymerase n=1 Tax=Dyella mobilis TaxID=1849582 RepID=A0ABS2KML6_9GAMM|nr:error-prone DNA polymerase [Dyella mobilis]MBM7132397.1 error-prone DNA polymerase [Dyella mobilis]GLQ95615.1 error-prone DNA polymerase [Dyella mobilis]
MSEYAELHCLSDFSFQRGASSARELFERARDCGYAALAITDECSLAGIVRAWEASGDVEVPLIVGTEIQLADGPKLVLLAENKRGYVAICRLITQGRRASEKGTYYLTRADVAAGMPGALALWIPGREPDREHGEWVKQLFGDCAWLAVELHCDGDDEGRLAELETLGNVLQLPLVASGDVHMHVRACLPLQHVMTAIRHHATMADAGDVLFRNGERHLRQRAVLEKIYPKALLDESVRIARRCTFNLKELQYQYPKELVPEGYTAMQWLRHLVAEGSAWRWPDGVPDHISPKIEHELRLIEKKAYEAFFLTVHDIVRYARSQHILCQGRGSAANSIVCFALGVTDADPGKVELLVERFISVERDEPPDIDVDFEHERREEVIQYVYKKYGRERAAIAATVISYRSKSAVRDVAKVLGLPEDQIDKLGRCFFRLGDASLGARLREQGFDPDAPVIRQILVLTEQLRGKPRHLSQHVGGFVIHDAPLHELVPVENATMADRTIIQWDKDDLDRMGLLKVDCLALGMLTCLRKCFDMVKHYRGTSMSIATIESDDKDTYAMIQRADTIGVFQIESRAQMAMLPRLKPASYYDLVIQIAIVRPGPIQGDMVHPYLRRRRGEEPVVYPSKALEPVLERTKGVPLFQEQVMKLAMVAAGYTPGEADQLRRAMGAWKRHGGMEKHYEKFINGMLENSYTREFAEQIFNQIKGFGSYGFPESHAASFANIAYASSWLKCHEPAMFACALLNAQPMGFYGPSQIVQDTQRHGIRVLPVDVRYSDLDCTLESDARSTKGLALRLGFRQLRGCSEKVAERISTARTTGDFLDVVDLCTRAELDRRHQDLLADAGALRGLAGHRHRALWLTAGVEAQLPLFGRTSPAEQDIVLPLPTTVENLKADYAHSGLSLGPHPLRLLRSRLRADRYLDSRSLQKMPHTAPVRIAGLVTQRQQPQTASGVTFMTIEDEFGHVNVVVWSHVAQTQRRPYLEARLLAVEGRWETADGVSHLIARRLCDLSGLLADLDARSRDFH